MKVRIKFSKEGPMKFVGHLDTMRYFQKALRRAELPVAFSGGYSPHMIMSFAVPLGVGMESLGDYFENAQLLIAADCTAYAYAEFHERFIKDHVTLIGCPKLDEGDYADKLTEIIRNNSIRSICIVRMEVPCCGGIEKAVIRAMQRSGKMIPWQVVIIARDGTIREEL